MVDQPDLKERPEDTLEHSPLERDIPRDGATVRVFIFRGRHDPGWILEIEDELGGARAGSWRQHNLRSWS